MASFFDLPPEGGIAAGEMADVEPQSVGQYDASQGFATPEARQYRVGQQVQRVKAKNFFGQRGIPTIDNGETVRPVVDEAGAPLTNFSNTASTGWDSWGQPRQVVQRPDGGVDLADPYQSAPVKIDKQGNRYRAPAGLEWRHDGMDEATVKANQDRATAAASSALSSQAAQDARDAKTAAKDIKTRQAELETAIPGLATLENPNDARKAIDDHFNELYAAPEANETTGFFGSGEYTPAAAQIRAGIDQSKAQAYAAYDDLGARKQQALTLQQQAEVNNARARELRRKVTADKLAKAEQDGAVIPQAPATPAAAPAQEGATPELPDDRVKQIIAKPEERIGYLQEIGRGLARGSVNLTKSLGGFLRLMGAETVGNFLKEAGEYYEDDYKASKEAEGFAPQNPRWWAARLPEVVPQLAGQLGLAFLTRGRSVPAQIAAFAAPTLATTAGDVYSEAVEDRLKKGQSIEEARDGAIGEAALVGTLAAGLDMIPGGEFLSKTPVVRSLMGKAIRNSVLRKGVAGFVAEGGTEAAQSVVQDLAALGFRDDSERFKDAWQRYSSDFLLGGVLGGVTDIAIGHPEATQPPASEPAPQGQPQPQSPAQGQAVPSNNPPDAVSSPEAEAPAAPEQPISSPSVVEPGAAGQPESATEPTAAPAEGDPADELAQAEQQLAAMDPNDPMYPLYEQSVETARARMLAAAKPIEPAQSSVTPQVEAQTSPEPVAAQKRTQADATPVSGQRGGVESTLGVGEPVSDSGVSAPATIPDKSPRPSQAEIDRDLEVAEKSMRQQFLEEKAARDADAEDLRKQRQEDTDKANALPLPADGEIVRWKDASGVEHTGVLASKRRAWRDGNPETEGEYVGYTVRDAAGVEHDVPEYDIEWVNTADAIKRLPSATPKLSNAGSPSEPTPTNTPSSAATEPTAVTPNQTAQPAATSAPSSKPVHMMTPSEWMEAELRRGVRPDVFGEESSKRRDPFTALKTEVRESARVGEPIRAELVDELKAYVPQWYFKVGDYYLPGNAKTQSEIPASSIDPYGIKLPSDYEKRGDWYFKQGVESSIDPKNSEPAAKPREWGDIVPSDDIGKAIETKDGRTGKVTAVAKNVVKFKTPDGKSTATTKGKARVVESGGPKTTTEQATAQSKDAGPKARPETNAERQKREEAELDADHLPAAATTSPEAQQSAKLAQAALRLHSDELRTLGHPVDIQTGETPNASGIYTTGKGRIVIDPEKLAKDTAKLTPAERLKKIKRAIAEEVTHVATLKYASENSDNYFRVQALANDAEWSKRAGDAYGKEWEGLSDFQKGAEIARMIIQGRGGKLTEASYRYLVDFMKWLRRKLKTLHPETRQVIADIESQMGRYKAGQGKGKGSPNNDHLGAASSNPNLQTELDALQAKHAPAIDSHVFVSSRSGEPILTLENIQARKDAPAGAGTAFMKDLVKLADANGATITLQTASKGDARGGSDFKRTSSEARLKDFYGRFGFKSNYGKRSYRADLPGNMHRLPREEMGLGAATSEANEGQPQRKASTQAEAVAAARQFIGKPITNADDGFTASLSGNNLSKMLSASAQRKSANPEAHYQAVANADHLFRDAVRGFSKPDRADDPNIEAIHRYFAPFAAPNGQTLVAKLTVKEFKRPSEGNRLYSVESLEVVKPARKWVASISAEEQRRNYTPHAGFEEKLQRKIEAVNGENDAGAPIEDALPSSRESTDKTSQQTDALRNRISEAGQKAGDRARSGLTPLQKREDVEGGRSSSSPEGLEPLFAASSEEQRNPKELTPEEALLVGPVIPKLPTRLVEGSADTLERTAGAEQAGKDLRKWRDNLDLFPAQATKPERDFQRAMGGDSKRITEAEKQVDEYFKAIEAGDEAGAMAYRGGSMTDDGRAALAAWEQATSDEFDRLKALDYQVKQSDGTSRGIRKVKNFHPRSPKKELRDAVLNMHKDPERAREVARIVLKHFGDTARPGEVPKMTTEAQALEYLRGEWSNETDFDLHGSTERARELKLPSELYDYSFKARNNYLTGSAERRAQVDAFGQAGRTDKENYFNKLIARMTDPRSAAYVAAIRDNVYGLTKKDALHKLMAGLNGIATGSHLANPVTIIANLTSGLGYTAADLGVGSSVKAVHQMIDDYAAAKNRAEDLGILSPDLMSLHRDAEKYESDVVNKIHDVTAAALKYTGYNKSEEWVRVHQMLTAEAFLNQALQSNGKKGDVYDAFFKRHNVDPAAIRKENGKGSETDKFYRSIVRDTQGGYKIDQVQPFLDSPEGKFLFKYQKWGFQQTRNFIRNVIAPALGRGGPRDVKPLLRYMTMTAAMGLGLAALKEALFGTPDRTVSFEEIGKTWDRDKIVALTRLAKKLLGAQISAGAYGALSNYGQMARDVADRSKVKSPLEPPGVSTVVNVGEQFLRLIEQKKLTAKDADDFLRAQLALYRTGKAAAGRLAETTGTPILKNERARQDQAWLSTMTRRFADEVGVEASRTSLGRIGKTEMSPAKRDILDAIRAGDVAGAKQALKAYMNDVPKEQRDTAMKSLAASVRASQPVKVGAAGEARRQLFIDWSRKNLPTDDVRRIARIDAMYRATAQRVGLLDPKPVTEKAMTTAKTKLGLTKPAAPAQKPAPWWN